ncbi:chondroitin AC/alginate lyase [Irpex rosettiformis]|uniref:Chondroitin AC/alginate lyase n=1 Tax=Irpex rosettiformis TaxID=378272 RepID=A0ACB8U1V8_9APHY|nr:chondroitin AC/alginate lyase [Irpex rosettiformis]
MSVHKTSALLLFAAACIPSVVALAASTYQHALANYANVFVDPNYVIGKNYSNTTFDAQQTILRWANDSAQGGPWSVTTKQYLAPSGDKHDYTSFAVYSWADCSHVGNTTQLTPEQIWKTCPYVTIDGKLNPEADAIPNADDFDSLANAVLYNGLAWGITGSSTYATLVATYIKAWFLDADTFMNPNLNYAQMQRGPGQNGTHTGVLDLKAMAKIASGILVLRDGKAQEWTSDIDKGFVGWINNYIGWLHTSPLALKEKSSTNNHGSYYFTQLAALQVMVGDIAGAKGTINEYLGGTLILGLGINGFTVLMTASQPLESSRTRPFHYRAYNLAAMITTARIADYISLSPSVWTKTTSAGSTITSALSFSMSHLGDATSDTEKQELYPLVASVAAGVGDANNTYSKFLSHNDGSRYITDPTFFWSQPLSDLGYVAASNQTRSVTTSAAHGVSTGTSGGKKGGGNGSTKEGTNGSEHSASVRVGMSSVVGVVVTAALLL